MRVSWVTFEEGVPELSLDDFTCKFKFEISKMDLGEGGEEKAKKEQMAVTSAIWRLRQENCQEFEASLGCIVSSKTA